MFVLMISRSSSKLGHLGSRCNIFEVIIMDIAHNVCLDDFYSLYVKFETRSFGLKKKTRSLGKMENLVNTLEVIFLNQSSWILLKLIVLMVSRSSLKLSHFWSKNWVTRPNQRKTLLTLYRSHFWSYHQEYCSKCLSWWFLGQDWNWASWGQKLGHQSKSKENLVNTLAVTAIIMNLAQNVCWWFLSAPASPM